MTMMMTMIKMMNEVGDDEKMFWSGYKFVHAMTVKLLWQAYLWTDWIISSSFHKLYEFAATHNGLQIYTENHWNQLFPFVPIALEWCVGATGAPWTIHFHQTTSLGNLGNPGT